MDVAFRQQMPWSLTKWEKIAGAAWVGLLLLTCLRAYLQPNTRTVYPIWSSTSHLWWSGGELYAPYRPTSVMVGFRYSPTIPILTTPFALFPDAIGGVLWRCCGTGLYAAAVWWWIRAVLPKVLSRNQKALLFLFMLPLSIQSMNNGQANILVITLLLATVAAVKECRWNWASLFLALAFAFKLYPLALGLLLFVLYPRKLGWRIPTAILAVLAFPFLTQQPGYVLDQYHKWYQALHADDRSTIIWNQMYRDLWLLICAVKAPIPHRVYELGQVLSGAALAFLCWRRQRIGWPESHSLIGTLALATAWMMLLGPATESSTFILLAPSLAWSCIDVLRQRTYTWRSGLLFASAGLLLLAVVLGSLPSALKWHSMGLHPVGTLLYLVFLVTEPRPRPAVTVAARHQATASAA